MSNFKTIILSLIVMALWGSLFPCIKIGYREFGIYSSALDDIIMFAGLRFVICGAVVSGVALAKRDKLATLKGKNLLAIVFIGLFSAVLLGEDIFKASVPCRFHFHFRGNNAWE